MKHTCHLCSLDILGLKGLSSHLMKIHHISTKDYYNQFEKLETEGFCLNCNKETAYYKFQKGYKMFCSSECKSEYAKTKTKNKRIKKEKHNKFKCKLCDRKLKSLMALSKHIESHDMSSQQYYDKFEREKGEGFCLNCKEPTLFRNFRFGYNKTCSHKCMMTRKLNHRFGIVMPDEVRKKISDANKGEHKIVKCLNCPKTFDIPVRSKQKYCSHSCATSYRNKHEDNPMFNKLSCLKMGRSQKKRLENKENHPMFKKKHKESSKQIMREKRLNRVLPFKDTKIEVALQETFKKENIKFTKHVNILNLTQPDIFIEPNICIYADGDYWHGDSFPERQRKDIQITQKLRRSGYSVFRFKEHKIKQNVEACINKVKNHLFHFKEFYLESLI